MMEVDRLAADLRRLGDKSVTELRKCVIIVSSLSADFEMECHILENNPAGLNKAEIERVVGYQYNRLLRQQQDSYSQGGCWNNTFCDNMKAIGFEQAKADPCVFRKVVDGEVEMVVVVHVDDILTHAKDQATMDRFAAELGQKFKLKDMGVAGYYMGCHITKNHKARELKLHQHLYVESMVKRFDVKKATKIPAASGVPTLSKLTNRGTQRRRRN